jgi:Holliday junction DNA helicase RuvB
LPIARFTLIGATTRAGLLASPLRARFGQTFKLSPYSQDELRQIVERSARILTLPLSAGVSTEIAKRGRGVPRIGNRILRRVRDYAQVHAEGIATINVALEALRRLGIDELGLDGVDRALIETLIDKFNGGPVSLKTIASAIDEDPLTVEEAHEPYLIQLGFLERTPRGRKVTYHARQIFRRHAAQKPLTSS